MAYPISAYFGRRTYAHLDACVYCHKPYDDSGGWHTLQQTIEEIDLWYIVCDGCYHEAAPEPGGKAVER